MKRTIRKRKLTPKEASEQKRLRNKLEKEYPPDYQQALHHIQNMWPPAAVKMYFISATHPGRNLRKKLGIQIPDCKTFGFLPSLELAKAAIRVHGAGMVECKWSNLVIEEYQMGLEMIPEERGWYEYVHSGYNSPDKPNWKPCKRPKYLEGTICFAMP
jgi:hypothetical protein